MTDIGYGGARATGARLVGGGGAAMTGEVPRSRPNPPSVLVVDDHPAVVDGLPPLLRQLGLRVTVARTVRARAEAATAGPALVVLGDVAGHRSPADDRFPAAALLRLVPPEEPFTWRRPTARHDALARPFALDDAVAAIRAAFRRDGAPLPGDTGILRSGPLVLDEDSGLVQLGGVLVPLTPTEYRLLRHLLQHAGQVVSKTQAVRRVWRYDFAGDPQVVEQYVRNLRLKLGGPAIRTVRGRGYALGQRRVWRA